MPNVVSRLFRGHRCCGTEGKLRWPSTAGTTDSSHSRKAPGMARRGRMSRCFPFDHCRNSGSICPRCGHAAPLPQPGGSSSQSTSRSRCSRLKNRRVTQSNRSTSSSPVGMQNASPPPYARQTCVVMATDLRRDGNQPAAGRYSTSNARNEGSTPGPDGQRRPQPRRAACSTSSLHSEACALDASHSASASLSCSRCSDTCVSIRCCSAGPRTTSDVSLLATCR